MQHLIKPYLQCFAVLSSPEYIEQAQGALIPLSQELLYAVRTGESVSIQLEALATARVSDLYSQLASDEQKKTFWINLYNATVQIALQRDVALYNNRPVFMSRPIITLAGQALSLDDIYHGMLRRAPRKNAPAIVSDQQTSLNNIDYRVHFALNAGSASCPPIVFYDDASINEKLTAAMKSNIAEMVKFAEGKVWAPAFFNRYSEDFGGIAGVKQILLAHGGTAGNKLAFLSPSEDLLLNNFRD